MSGRTSVSVAGRKLYPMGLIFSSLMFLILPGMILNNFTNSNLNIAGEPNLVCAAASANPDPTCHGSTIVGCQAASPSLNPCALDTSRWSGGGIAFLNAQSPFTQLFSGNIVGFLGGLFSNQKQPITTGPFDIPGGGTYLTANCIVGLAGLTPELTHWTFDLCSQANPDGSNSSLTCSTSTNCASTWGNWNNQLFKPSIAHFYQIGVSATNSSMIAECQYQTQTNYTFASAGFSGWTYYGCDYSTAGGVTNGQVTTKLDFSVLYAVPYAIGKLTGGYTCAVSIDPNALCFHVRVPAQLESWDTKECINFFTPGSANFQTLSNFYSPQCQRYLDQIKSMQSAQSGQPGSGGNNLNLGFLTPVFTFILGLVIFFLALGLKVRAGGAVFGTGGDVEVGANRQGTKFAQVMGVGLIIWSAFYSMFSSWFTSGILPYGLDGPTGVISIILTGMFFAGVYWQATQD